VLIAIELPLKFTCAFGALCFVNVIGPVPAASLIVVALISDNAQVPPSCNGESDARGHRERPSRKCILSCVYCDVCI